MFVEKQNVSITTDSGGNNTTYSGNVTGRVLGVVVAIPGTGGIANTADLTMTVEGTGESLLALTNVAANAAYYPRSQVHGITGSGLTLDGTRLLVEPLAVSNDRVKIVTVQGGDTKTATVTLLVG